MLPRSQTPASQASEVVWDAREHVGSTEDPVRSGEGLESICGFRFHSPEDLSLCLYTLNRPSLAGIRHIAARACKPVT